MLLRTDSLASIRCVRVGAHEGDFGDLQDVEVDTTLFGLARSLISHARVYMQDWQYLEIKYYPGRSLRTKPSSKLAMYSAVPEIDVGRVSSKNGQICHAPCCINYAHGAAVVMSRSRGA